MLESARPRYRGSARTDALLALGLFVAAELELALAGLGLGSALIAAVATLALAFRRGAPLLTMAVVVAAFFVDQEFGGDWTGQTNIGFVLLLLAAYSVGAHAARTRSLAAVCALAAAMALAEFLEHGSDYPFLLFVVGMPWLAGRAVRRYRGRADRLAELA